MRVSERRIWARGATLAIAHNSDRVMSDTLCFGEGVVVGCQNTSRPYVSPNGEFVLGAQH